MSKFHEVEEATIAHAFVIAGHEVCTMRAWLDLGETHLRHKVTADQRAKLVKSIDENPEIGIKGETFLARVTDARNIVTACGGTAESVEWAIEELNEERADQGKVALRSLNSNGELYKTLVGSASGRKSVKAETPDETADETAVETDDQGEERETSESTRLSAALSIVSALQDPDSLVFLAAAVQSRMDEVLANAAADKVAETAAPIG